MLKLKNVSKFYYSNGVIASGFTKINLELKMGEFVVITGESGSGKSTLLNVLSGLDSYEEGEMYINNEETSHYSETDFENYRKQYVGNIFQSFNLINSYTVYQNVELVLLLNGYKKKEIKKDVLNILNKVGLLKFKNTKVSKLSGGQRQRVAIARALAKETPIIVADEPTGNLDSKSADEVMALLSEIAKDKLVIVVTHNIEQVEKYATRLIKMHDGRILEDKTLVEHQKVEEKNTKKYKKITLFNKIRLGLRNTFNVLPKFLLTFAVFFFVALAVLSEYSSFQKAEYESSKYGENSFFNISSDKRIVLKKKDGTNFTENDYSTIKSMENVDYIIEDDILLDIQIELGNNYLYFMGNVNNINTFSRNVDFGRMPESEYEIIIALCEDDYEYFSFMTEEILNKEFSITDRYTGEAKENEKLKIVGITKSENEGNNYNYYSDFYVSDAVFNKLRLNINEDYSTVKALFNDKLYDSTYNESYFHIVPNDKVEKGKALVSKDLNELCKNGNCKNKNITIYVENMYYKDELTVTINNTYTKNSFEKLTGLKEYEKYNGTVFINKEDYNNLYNKATYQSSVYVSDVNFIDQTEAELQKLGYKTLQIRKTIDNSFYEGMTQVTRIFKVIVTATLLIALFFIAYFVIKIILKSRNIYFSTIRMLGANRKVAKQLLDIELFTISNLAYGLLMGLILMANKGLITVNYIKELSEFLTVSNYVFIYFILIIMSQIVSSRFSSTIFNKTAINAYKEEV